MSKYDPEYIDREEKNIMESIKKMDVRKIEMPTKDEQDKIKSAAKDFLRKKTKMNIRIDEYELMKIKEFAEKEGLRYQTFVKSIMHKYITGQLTETRKAG